MYLQEFFQTATIFLRLEKIQFGGTKGQSLSDLVEGMFNEFTDMMNTFVNRPEDPLDISNNVCVYGTNVRGYLHITGYNGIATRFGRSP